MLLVTPAASHVTKGLQSQVREDRPGFGPTPKLPLYRKASLPLPLGVRGERKSVWDASFSQFAPSYGILSGQCQIN